MSFDSHSRDHTSPRERIDQLCDAFEAQWLKGERPRIADFVDRLPSDEQPALFYELMLVDLEYRRKAGEQPSRHDYLRDYSRFGDKISAVYLEFGEAAFATVGAQKDGSVSVPGREAGGRVGHFELRELLGTGAMGDVWKAWDPRLQRPVAVKLPRVENLTKAETLRFLREGRAAAQLRHPNLAAVHEVDRDGDTPYIASEFVDGENLREYCDRSKLAVTTASSESMNRRLTFYAIADLCAEIAEALHHAHEQGVVHRDLKPANIIIDRANRPHVIDFGLAKWATDDRDLTLHGELLGTPAYMSPEQAAGNAAKLDRRTDVYSLGVILYELLSGQCPFTGEMGSMIHQIIAVEPPPVRKLNAKVPRDLETICIKALEKNPDRRYATMQEMAVDLRRCARGEPILSRRAGPLERSWRWVRRHPGVAAAILAIVLILSTSGAVIRSLNEKNYHLQEHRLCKITTSHDDARIAIVPIDDQTGEPTTDPSAVIRPKKRTPVDIELKPGNYLIEALLARDDGQYDFAESYEVVPHATEYVKPEALTILLRLRSSTEVLANMVAVPVAEALRRENPLLPKLLYVDQRETKPRSIDAASENDNTFVWAQSCAQSQGKRLPSAVEYEAIIRAANENEISDATTGKPAKIDDLFGGVAEWTTTKWRLKVGGPGARARGTQNSHELAGYGDPDKLTGFTRTPDNKLIAAPEFQSRYIGFRGVRSASPRFLTP